MTLAGYFLSYFTSWKYTICINICVCPWSGTLVTTILVWILESPLVEEESNMQHQRMPWRDRMTHMLPLKGTETHNASCTPWPVTGGSKAYPLGPRGRVALSCESRVYFVKLPSPLHSPTPWFTRSLRALLVPPPNQGGEWRSHSTPRLLHLVFNHTVKEFSLQGPTDPCCPLHPHSPAHSHIWIPAITSLGSEVPRDTLHLQFTLHISSF